MNTDAIDADHKPLAVRGEMVDESGGGSNLALFGTTDPVDVITKAARVADALKAMIVKKKLVANIQGKEYPQVEAWQTLAVMLGLSTICEWSRPVEDGWEARVIVQRNGMTIAAAEAQCLKTEKSKRAWEDYAIRSMAQTRATSKSLRSVLGFVMVLAGYEATPAEEMPGDKTPTPATAKTPPAESAEQVEARKAEGIKRIHAYCGKNGIDTQGPDSPYRRILLETFSDVFSDPAVPISSKALDLPQLQQLSLALQRYVKAQDTVEGTL